MDLRLGGDLKYHLKFTHKDGFPGTEARCYTAEVLLSLAYLRSLLIVVATSNQKMLYSTFETTLA